MVKVPMVPMDDCLADVRFVKDETAMGRLLRALAAWLPLALGAAVLAQDPAIDPAAVEGINRAISHISEPTAELRLEQGHSKVALLSKMSHGPRSPIPVLSRRLLSPNTGTGIDW